MSTLEHHVTRSSMIAQVAYNEEDKILTVTFSKGDEYIYKDVPREIYNELIASESIGKYFLANIKNKYQTEKV